MTNRKTHWEEMYKHSLSEVSWYQQHPSVSLQLIEAAQVAKDSAIIDIGGGTAVLVDHLLDAGYRHLSVLDISQTALSCAQERLGDKAAGVDWIVADITTFKGAESHPCSLWHDRAVFHFLTDASDRKKYVRTLKRSLRIGGHVIIATFAPNGPTQCSGLDVVRYNDKKIIRVLGKSFKLISQVHEKHLTPRQHEQLFSYFYFRRITP